MAMTRTVSLPEEIVRLAEELAAQHQVSLEEFVSAALAEQFAGAEDLKRRGERASAEGFRAALDRISDADPEPHDRLP
jgi:hypothetical protein